MPAGSVKALAGTAWGPAAFGNDTTCQFYRLKPACDYNLTLANNIAGVDGPTGEMLAWSGATYDTQDKMLIMWGGGHNDYFDNAVYAFSMPTLSWQRLTTPSNPIGVNCSSAFAPDGNPWNLHTYEILSYLPATNEMIVAGGAATFAQGCNTALSFNNTYAFNLTTFTWSTLTSGSGAMPFQLSPDLITGFNSSDSKVYAISVGGPLWAFTRGTPTWTVVGSGFGGTLNDYHQGGAVQPGVRLVTMSAQAAPGGTTPGINVVDLATGNVTSPTTTGDQTAMNYVGYTGCGSAINGCQSGNGLAWDSHSGEFVAMVPGSSTIYRLTPGTWNWVANSMTIVAGTTLQQEPTNYTGLYGRWQYLPSYDCFVAFTGFNDPMLVFKPNF